VLDDTPFLVFRGDNDQLYWTAFDVVSSAWLMPTGFGQGMETAAAPALATVDDTLFCVHHGTDDDLYWTRYETDTDTWVKDR